MLDFTENQSKLFQLANQSENEVCGFVLKSGEIIELDNIAEDKKETWMIHPLHYLKYKKDILYIYHSHPEGGPPSEDDKIGCNRIKLPFLVISLPNTLYYINPGDQSCLQFDFTDI